VRWRILSLDWSFEMPKPQKPTTVEDEFTPEELEEIRRRYEEYRKNPPTVKQLRQPNLLDDLFEEFEGEEFSDEELDEIASLNKDEDVP
jgi:hypothetical protein